jgi:hypothetical protein
MKVALNGHVWKRLITPDHKGQSKRRTEKTVYKGVIDLNFSPTVTVMI